MVLTRIPVPARNLRLWQSLERGRKLNVAVLSVTSATAASANRIQSFTESHSSSSQTGRYLRGQQDTDQAFVVRVDLAVI
jgi:hypothetical protein